MFKIFSNKTLITKCSQNFQIFSIKYSQYQNHYDIAIAGGGMVGTTLACALGKNKKLQNKKILLLENCLEKQITLSIQQPFSNRVSSINPGSKKLLEKLDIWEHIKNIRYSSVKQMQIWDALSNVTITFNNDDFKDAVSYIVENDLILLGSRNELKKLNNVNVQYGIKVKSYELPLNKEDNVKIHLENNTTITCELLLGCDGANSQVRNAMGVQYLSWDYNQMGIVATLKLSEAEDNLVAWQRFLPTGPVAILPLQKNLSSLVWSTTSSHAKQLLSLTEQEFVQNLNEALYKEYTKNVFIDQAIRGFDDFLHFFSFSHNVKQLPPKNYGAENRAAFPLGFGHAANYIGLSTVLVGDAAHRVHPLAGQGVNLGFGDIMCLNSILGEAAYSGSKLNNMEYLRNYETERQKHNVPTMIAIEGLHRLYTSEFTPFVLLRSLGLQATNALGPLKKSIMKHASV